MPHTRHRRRRPPRRPPDRLALQLGGSVASASPVEAPRLVGVPQYITVLPPTHLSRLAQQEPFDSNALTPARWLGELGRFARAGFLRPDDRLDLKPTDDPDALSSRFLAVATGRAFPAAPRYENFTAYASYVFQQDAIGEMLSPNEGWDDHKRRRHVPRAWVAVSCDEHRWMSIRPMAEHLQKHHGLGPWLADASFSMLTISPHFYVDWVGAAHWCHERDESEAIANYGEEEFKQSGIPTRKEFDELIPAWVRGERLGRERFLRDCAKAKRVLGVDVLPAFDVGRRKIRPLVDWDDKWREIWHEPHPVMCFGWSDNDMIQHAVDECFECAMNSGDYTHASAVFAADSLALAAEKLRRTWQVLAVIDQLADALRAYRKRFKLT